MNRTEIRALLEAQAEPSYRDFHTGLVPGLQNMLGVRMPALRALAKQLVREDNGAVLLSEPPSTDSYEETMLWGLTAGAAKLSFDARLAHIETFVPYITNWALCDGFVSSLRFRESEKTALRRFLTPYLTSSDEFRARFGAVMLLRFFITESALTDTVHALVSLPAEGYQARMGAAWALAECVLRFPAQALPLIDAQPPCRWVYHKTMQKLLESRRLPEALRAPVKERRNNGCPAQNTV